MAAKHYTAKIPFSRLVKIGIWSNQAKRQSMSTIYSTLKSKYPGKEVYIVNGGFFNMSTFKAIFDLKASGVTYSKQFTMAYMGMKDNTIKFDYGEKNSAKYTDLVTAYPILIEKGVKSPNFEKLDNNQRGRSMLGYTNNEVIISCIQDVNNNSDFSVIEELNYMLAQKCTYAINLDGGGSSQCNFNGKVITSSRIVNNFVYAIVNPEKVQESTTPSNNTNSSNGYSVGSTIKLKTGAKWVSGKAVPKWVMNSTLYCRAINGNNITISTQKTGAVTGTIHKDYIIGSSSTSTTNTTTTTSSSTNGTKYKITATKLNIRSTYNTSGKIVGTVIKNQIVEIIEVKNKWGKLADNSGWISLYYTKKL